MNCNSSPLSPDPLYRPLVEFQTVLATAVVSNVTRDLLVKFSRPYKHFMVSSIANTFSSCAIYLHLDPLNLPSAIGANQITPAGNEHWIPLAWGGAGNTYTAIGRIIKFSCPISFFYIDADHGAGAGSTFPITFAGTNEIDLFNRGN